MIIDDEGAMSIEKRLVSGRYETRRMIIDNERAMSIGKLYRKDWRQTSNIT